jgi:hypothetical protein
MDSFREVPDPYGNPDLKCIPELILFELPNFCVFAWKLPLISSMILPPVRISKLPGIRISNLSQHSANDRQAMTASQSEGRRFATQSRPPGNFASMTALEKRILLGQSEPGAAPHPLCGQSKLHGEKIREADLKVCFQIA